MKARSRTYDLLTAGHRPALLVSLPANDITLARAAVDGGAEGLKVHLNIQHAAAGVRFGSLAEEADALAAIVALGLPVGVVPGDATAMIAPGETRRLAELGLDFVDVYLEALPAWLLGQDDVPVMAALSVTDLQRPWRMSALAALESVSMVEASVIPHEAYGGTLSAADLCDYTGIVGAMTPSAKPVIVPTQRHILPEDLVSLVSTGIAGLLIGAIVTGQSPDGICRATRRYRDALEQIGAGR